MFAGAVVWLGYIIASGAELLFKLAISILQVTNPFNWFAKGFNYTWTNADEKGMFSALTNTVSGLYKLFAEFGWTVMIPLTIAIWIFMFIFTGNGRQNQTLTKSKAEKFRYFIVYFLFLAVGVPVMGTAYTAGLDALSETFNKDNVGNGGVGVDAIIYSAYIDNKAWIENNRLYLPSDVDLTWDTSISDVPYQNKAKVRQYALSINSLNHLDLKKATDNGSADNSWNLSNKQTGDSKTSEGVNTILLRYMLGESYLPSDWETKVKSYLSEAAGRGDSEDSKKPGSLVNRLNASATELTSKEGYKYIAYVNPHVQDGDPETWGVEVNEGWFGLGKTYRFGQYPNIFLSRGYADEGNGGFIAKNSSGAPGSSSKSDRLNFESNPNATVKQGMVYGNTKATMSYLEMFNYLNSKFTATKVRVYSTNTLTSNFSRESHAAVNQVGAGYVHKFMIWINTVTLLFGVAFLAVGYAVGMVVASFKRYINLVTSIFLGTLGMQKGMVKAASATIMLIFEVVGTIVIYELAKTIYIAIPDILSNAISGLNNGSKVTSTALTNIGFSAGAANMGGFVLVIFSLMLSVIVLVWMLLMLLRLRKPIIDMADSTFTTMIGKLFYADGSLGHGDDTKGESGGMTNAISAVSGFVAGNSSSNIEGAEGDDNDGYVAGDESSTETNGGNGAEDEQGEKPDPNSKKANSKETEGIGEKVKSEGGIDRNGQESASESEQPEGTNGEQASSGGPTSSESSSGSGSSNGSESVSGTPSSSGSGDSEQGTVISDDDTVNVSTAEGGSESGKGSSGKVSKSSGANGAKSSGSSGKNDEVSASSESPKQASSDAQSETDSPSELAERGLSEASKVSASSESGKQSSIDDSEQELFGPSIATAEGGQGLSKSNGGLSSGESGKQQNSNQTSKTPISKSVNNTSSVKSNDGIAPGENGKQQNSSQSGKTSTAKSNGSLTPSESGKQQGVNQTSVSSSPVSKASQHMEQAKQNLSSAKDSAKQVGSSAVTASKQAVSGVRDVANGISGVVSGQQSISNGASQVASGAKQMVQSVSSAGNAIRNGASTVSQSASAISNATKSAASAVGSSAVVSQASRIGNSVAKGVTTAANTQLGKTLINTALDRSSSPVSSSGSTPQRQTSQSTSSTGSSGQQQTVLRQSSAGSGSNGGQTIVRNQSNTSNDNRTSNSRNTSMTNRPSSSGSIPRQNASGNGGQSLDRPQSGSGSTGTNTSAPTSGIKRVANTTGKVVKATAKGMMATGEKLDPVGRHIENELKKSIGDMAPTSSASSNGLDADFMERSHLAEMERLRRRNRTTRPR